MASYNAPARTLKEALAVLTGRAIGDPDVAAVRLLHVIQQEALGVLRRELSEVTQPAEDATQEDSADAQPAWLPTEDARRDAVPDAIDAAPQFMQDAYQHMQEARQALWTADTDSGIAQVKDALDGVMSALETYAEVLADGHSRTVALSLSALRCEAKLETHCDICRRPVDLSHAVKYEDGYFCPACASGEMRRDAQLIHRLQQKIAALRARLKGTQPAQDATAAEDDLPF